MHRVYIASAASAGKHRVLPRYFRPFSKVDELRIRARYQPSPEFRAGTPRRDIPSKLSSSEEQQANARINWAISCREWLHSCIHSRHRYSEQILIERGTASQHKATIPLQVLKEVSPWQGLSTRLFRAAFH